ncbi:MAG: HAD-IA family hydrolase [Deltaproteobacteria bacterium]
MTLFWSEVAWVLLDMDGTLLDKHFDDYFWETLVPEEYARRQGMDLELARDLVFARYQREEGTLNWTLVTNAHYKTLNLKMNHTGLLGYFDAVVSSFDLGAPKEEVRFWEILRHRLNFNGHHALLVDDNAEALAAARSFGIKYAFFKAKSSSRLDAATHPDFPSIESFRELMD